MTQADDDIIDLSKRITARDAETPHPGERAAEAIGALFTLADVTFDDFIVDAAIQWDLYALAIELVNTYAMMSGDDLVLSAAKHISSNFYTTHYSLPPDHPNLKDTRSFWRELTHAAEKLPRPPKP